MKIIKPNLSLSLAEDDEDYYAVEEDGVLRCSCGSELIQLDEDSYRCAGGYPTYRFSEGSIILDKFGNLMIKKGDHGKKKN